MIINEQKSDVAVCGNFKTTGFKIQASQKAFDILSSNIYTHKVRAVIREISCNAVDSHTAAGNPDPIKVHLPTKLEPHFSVRDFGTGLSDEDVREIFTTYFCSTKTSSNDFVGALGLGSKSPFCLVDSFTVTSFFNGTKNLYSCYRDENGEPQVALLTSEDTDEHNGVEVSMAVEDRYLEEFTLEAESVYFYFDQIPNINKQSSVDCINNRKSKIILNTDDVCVERWGGWNDVYAVMGGVAYEIPSSISTLNIHGYLKFKMGEISFDAGRESLSLDDKTVNAIKTKIESVKKSLRDQVVKIINAEPTAFLRAQMADKMRSAPGVQATDIDPFYLPATKQPMKYYSKRGWRGGVDEGETHNLSLNGKTRYFKYKPRFGGRIKEEVKSTGCVIMLLNDEQIAETKIDANVLEDLDTLPQVERTTKTGRSYQKQGSILIWNDSDCYKISDRWDECTDIPNGEKVYVEVHRNEVVSCSCNLLRTARSLGVKIYGVKKTVINSKGFENDGWISLKDYMTREYKEVIANTKFNKSLDWKWESLVGHMINIAKKHELNCDLIKKFTDQWFEGEDFQTYRVIASNMGWEISEDDRLDRTIEEITMKHPMVEYFKPDCRADEDKFQKTFADYINRI